MVFYHFQCSSWQWNRAFLSFCRTNWSFLTNINLYDNPPIAIKWICLGYSNIHYLQCIYLYVGENSGFSKNNPIQGDLKRQFFQNYVKMQSIPSFLRMLRNAYFYRSFFKNLEKGYFWTSLEHSLKWDFPELWTKLPKNSSFFEGKKENWLQIFENATFLKLFKNRKGLFHFLGKISKNLLAFYKIQNPKFLRFKKISWQTPPKNWILREIQIFCNFSDFFEK